MPFPEFDPFTRLATDLDTIQKALEAVRWINDIDAKE